jgi:hypothetical protein
MKWLVTSRSRPRQEARRVFDVNGSDGESLCVGARQLEQGLQTAHGADDGRRFQPRLRGGDVERVGFVVAEPVGTVGSGAAFDDQAGRAAGRDRDTGLDRQLRKEAARGALESQGRRGREFDAKVAVEAERRAGGFDLLRPGHQAPRRWSGDRRRSAEEKQGGKTKEIHGSRGMEADPPRRVWTRS